MTARSGAGWAIHSPSAVVRAGQLLLTIDRVAVSREVLTDAASLEPPGLRTLDAIHLATARALALGRSLSTILVHDTRIADAATSLGLSVDAPV